jgi:hypothetical protein
VRRKHQREQWAVFIPNHHDGYIRWAVYENNQASAVNSAFNALAQTVLAQNART